MVKKSPRRKVKILQYNAVIQEEKEGGYSVWVPALPGCCSQGETFEKAIENVQEAIELYLDCAPEILEYGDETNEKQFLIPVKIHYA